MTSSQSPLFQRPLLGYEVAGPRSFGLSPARPPTQHSSLVTHDGPSHLLSVAPTGSGKTTQIIDNALMYAGSMIIVDIKGDIARATARFRTELGQQVHVLDPFNETGLPTARLDPLSIFHLPGIEVESEAETIAATLMGEQRSTTKEIYWPIQGCALIAAVVAHLARGQSKTPATMNALTDLLFAEDTIFRLALAMENEVKKGSYEAAGIASFLVLPDSSANTRGCVLSTAQAGLAAFRSHAVRQSLGPSTLQLADLIADCPMTIYLVMPLERLHSHGVILRLWIDTLLQALLRRRRQIDPPTLVIIDEAAQLGTLPVLRTISTFLRGNGVRLWTLWQDASQLSSLYSDWQTLVNNTSAQIFMAGSGGTASKQLAELAGVAPTTLRALQNFEQLVCEAHGEPRLIRVPTYWNDARFAGRFDPLPRYDQVPPSAAAGL